MGTDPIRKHLQAQTKGQAILGIVFGMVFFGIGISVMAFVWTGSGFGAPPLFFRIFATLIAIPFVAVGGITAYGSIQALRGSQAGVGQIASLLQHSGQASNPDDESVTSGSRVSYTCPACGAPLARGAEVSPHGDVKCSHCGGWFNVHKSTR
jgi:DNA-directed RNA polymerase subunit RPC12/RpoP